MNRQADNSFLDGWTDRYKATQTDLQADGWAYRSTADNRYLDIQIRQMNVHPYVFSILTIP
jgi:hypothetical protein